MKEILLTQGYETIVNDEDFARFSSLEWHALKGYKGCRYAMRTIAIGTNKRKNVFLHRLILDAPKGTEVDHIDGDGLNNQRSNLRLATHMQNTCNRNKPKHNTTGYKGVRSSPKRKGWYAVIALNRKRKYLGTFPTKELAYAAYCEEARKLHGRFANVN